MDVDDSGHGKTSLPFSPPFFYGWIIVGLAALTLFFSGPGQTYSVSTFIDSYIEEFGWSRSMVSGMYSMGTLAAGLLMSIIGNLFDRKGHRMMTAAIAIMFGLACFGMSRVNSVTMLLAGFFAIRLLGQGSMGLSSTTLPPQWFIRKKGRALSLVSLGGAISSALLPPLNTWLIQNFDWRTGWQTWAVLLWLVMAPVAYFVIRDRPEDVGLWPDDEKFEVDEWGTVADTAENGDWTVGEAMRTRSFWLLLFCIMTPSAIVTGLIFHQVSIMSQVGLTPEVAALVLSAMAIVRLPVVLVAGQVADRTPVRYLLAASMGTLLLSVMVLLIAHSVMMALIYGVIVGIMMAFQGIISGVVWPDYYGRRNLSSIRGVTMMAGVIGSAMGPLPYGFAYDIFGNYTQALTISMIFPVLGIAAALLAKPPKKRTKEEA
jgi:MFS family permease